MPPWPPATHHDAPPPPLAKKPRTDHHHHHHHQSFDARMPLPPLPPASRGSRIIHKNRLCIKFATTGNCGYGNACTFAHGYRELRWHHQQQQQQQQHYHSHRDGQRGWEEREEEKWVVAGESAEWRVGGGGGGGNFSDNNWKTRLCNKWDTKGRCPYGDNCSYAHGFAELKKPGGNVELDKQNSGDFSGKTLQMPTGEEIIPDAEPTCPHKTFKGGFTNWKSTKKLNGIYGDWIDDYSLCQKFAQKS